MNYLDFNLQEKGYKKFYPTRDAIKQNIGKIICYVDFVEPYRGTYFVRYGKIHSIKYNRLFLNEMEREVNINDILECGIEI